MRTNSGNLVREYLPNLVIDPYKNDSVSVTLDNNSQLSSYQYMWEKPEDIENMLDDRIEGISAFLANKYNLETQAPLNTISPIDYTTTCLICNEGDNTMNAKSIYLQSSTALTGSSARLKLDLTEINEYDLFPGQVVTLRGRNAYGTRLVATSLFSNAKQPPRTPEGNGGGLKVMVAAGPFSSPEDLDYDPFVDFLDQVHQNNPDLLVLLGPFVDVNNNLVVEGLVESTFLEVFRNRFLYRLSNVRCSVVLVPSLKDVFHSQCFPQPPINPSDENVPSFYKESLKHVTFAPNPCTFVVNDISFGVCTNDILLHLSRLSLCKSTTPSPTRITKICQLLFQQQSYYPLWPGYSTEDLSECSQICAKQAGKLRMPYSPDVLLLTSSLMPFVEEIEGSLVVNANKLGAGNMVYSMINVAPPGNQRDNKSGPSQRTNVKIHKI
uniref:DNA polymerase alpha subunit B n=1 Tax=Arcella intermedia TaxID=1963864 RepID=A0A6B2L2G8_9EUKA